MKVFTCTSFIGTWPVGTAAVISARNRGHAKKLLLNAFKQAGLDELFQKNKGLDVATFKEFDPTIPHALILLDGDY